MHTLAAPALREVHIQTDYVGLLGGLVHGSGEHADSGFARLVVHNTAVHYTFIPFVSSDGELAVHWVCAIAISYHVSLFGVISLWVIIISKPRHKHLPGVEIFGMASKGQAANAVMLRGRQ